MYYSKCTPINKAPKTDRHPPATTNDIQATVKLHALFPDMFYKIFLHSTCMHIKRPYIQHIKCYLEDSAGWQN